MRWLRDLDDDARAVAMHVLSQAQQDMMRQYFHRQIVEHLECRRAMFLGPHADDIVIGCGGAVLGLIDSGAAARFIYLTDGGGAAASEAEEPAMIARRVEETREVATKLRLGEPLQMACPESRFTDASERTKLVEALAREIEAWQPDSVFVPYLFEQHSHHRYANRILADALGDATCVDRVFQYEVWSFLPGNRVIDLTHRLERKLDLIQCYRSQIEIFDYVEYARLAALRHAPSVGSGALGGEVFLELPRDAYREAVAALEVGSPSSMETEVLLTPTTE